MPDCPRGDLPYVRFGTLVALVAVAFACVPAAAQAARPAVKRFSFSPSSFSAASGSTIKFTLSKRARVKIRISQRLAGRVAGGRSRARRCVKPKGKLVKRKRCIRYVDRGLLVRARQPAGERALAFSGELRGRVLAAGRYRATIVAIDRRGRRSRAKRTRFTVVRGNQPPGGNPTPSPPQPPAPPGAQRRTVRPCTVTLPSVAAVTSAVASANPGSVVCLAAGSYGELSLSASPAREVVVQPAGSATIAGADIGGRNITLEGFQVTGEVSLRAGSDHIRVQFNAISGGYMGVNLLTDDDPISDVAIVGNRFVGPFGEDGIRANRYHDGDGDGVGLLVEGNEFTNIRENGNHSDCLQSVWVGDHLVFRRNYLHDNRCQGFFIKDQASPVDTVVVEDNLMLRNAAPCDGGSCGQPVVLHLFGPMSNLTVRNNTIWTPEGGSQTALREGGWGTVSFSNNVVSRLWSDSSAPFAGYSASNNVARSREGTWPGAGVSVVAAPRFQNPAADDYRTNDGRGVTWAPAEQQYGP